MEKALTSVPLFNSPIETGIRAAVLLHAAFPRAFDLTAMAWFDHLIVHTGDIDGPVSLHPAVPQRTGELLVRRRLVEDGLVMMRRLHVVEVVPDGLLGLLYRATEESGAIVELLRSPYAIALRQRAEWLSENVIPLPTHEIEKLIAGRLGRWSVEFEQVDVALKDRSNG